jgi:hypothetical protein
MATIRTVIRVALALLVIHALYQFVPVYINYHMFKDDVKQTVLFGGGASQQQLVEQVMRHAETRQVPLDRNNVWVRTEPTQIVIDAAYEQPVKVLPWHTYTWHVNVSGSALLMSAPRRGTR